MEARASNRQVRHALSAHGVGIIKSMVLAFVALVVYRGMFLVFNR